MQKLKSKAKKIAVGIALAVVLIVLLVQYIVVANLSSRQSSLQVTLQRDTAELEQLQNQYDDIAQNYEDYVEECAHDDGKVKDNEILINYTQNP